MGTENIGNDGLHTVAKAGGACPRNDSARAGSTIYFQRTLGNAGPAAMNALDHGTFKTEVF
jgi:hypothetical protein